MAQSEATGHEMRPIPRESDLRKILGYDANEDFTGVVRAASKLRIELQNVRSVGATLAEQKGSGRKEYVIPLESTEQFDRITKLLAELSIYPWSENGLLIIDHRRDLATLMLAGLIPEDREIVAPANLPVRSDEFSFPIPESPGTVTFPSGSSPKARLTEKPTHEVSELDEELREIVEKFDRGIIDDDDPRFTARIGIIPSLRLFPQRYTWRNGSCVDSRSGAVVTQEKRDEQLARAQEGDAPSLRETLQMHVGFVLRRVALAKKRYPNADADDLFQEGMLGLMTAILRHDASQGSLLTFAAYFIDGRMLRFAKEFRTSVYLPSNTSVQRRAYFAAENAAARVDEPRSIEEIAHDEGLISHPSRIALDRFLRTYLLYATFDPNYTSALDSSAADNVVDMTGKVSVAPGADKSMVRLEYSKMINRLLSTLTPIEERVIRLRFGIRSSAKYDHDMTLQQIGETLGLTGESVRRIEGKALRRLTHPSRSKHLREALLLDSNLLSTSERRKDFSDFE